VAIVGPTGSGKSTLLSLVARLHDPPPGTLFVDGVDVRRIPLQALRGAIGMVPQEPFLFSMSVGDNIAFGLPPAGTDPGREAAIGEAAAVARIDTDLQHFPNGLRHDGGGAGAHAVGRPEAAHGDRARAASPTPASCCSTTRCRRWTRTPKRRSLRRLRVVMRERTSILVSHRVSTVRQADLILVLDAGRITERGTHDELVARGGFYAELFRKQQLEEELAAS